MQGNRAVRLNRKHVHVSIDDHGNANLGRRPAFRRQGRERRARRVVHDHAVSLELHVVHAGQHDPLAGEHRFGGGGVDVRPLEGLEEVGVPPACGLGRHQLPITT